MKNISLDLIREEIIGSKNKFATPYGERIVTYADYTASGKSLKFIEKYLIQIQKYYANSHTEDDITGESMTKLLHESERIIKNELNAIDHCSVISGGTGSTGAILRFSKIMGLYMPPATKKTLLASSESPESVEVIKELLSGVNHKNAPVVFIGPYEHHSNVLLWRESIADVVEIKLNEAGYLDLEDLEEKVSDSKYNNRVKIGSFSAASNVTGVKTEVYEVARILHKYDALACFDFAASGPYVKIDMNYDEVSYFDAVYLSPHKFLGGPGSSGILVIRNDLYDLSLPPTVAGGGTVDYVSGFGQDYVDDIEEREKAGTPGILQIVKAALAIQLKSAVGLDVIEDAEVDYTEKFFNRFKENDNIEILGPLDPSKRLSIISFMVKYEDKYLHPRFITKLLNDLFGIQSRAGCSCAGPYGHHLLGIDDGHSDLFRESIKDGINSLKPGWVRINLHYAMNNEMVEFLLGAIDFISNYAYLFLQDYNVDIKSGTWSNVLSIKETQLISDFGINDSINYIGLDVFEDKVVDLKGEYSEYFENAIKKVNELKATFSGKFHSYESGKFEDLNWFYFVNSTNNYTGYSNSE